jgi:hypothetical protein
VWADAPAGVVEAVSDGQGRFSLFPLPAGEVDIRFTVGSFQGVGTVRVCGGVTTVVEGGAAGCLRLDGETRLAVVTGTYDRVQDVLADLGFTQVETFGGPDGTYRGRLLEDAARLSSFAALFLNAGLKEEVLGEGTVALENLRAYVADGHGVYASDWAHFLVETAWPEAVDFWGRDVAWDEARVGVAAEAVVVTAGQDVVAQVLGDTVAQVGFRTGSWVVMESVLDNVTVYLRGDVVAGVSAVPAAPLAVGFRPGGGGRVVFTSLLSTGQATASMDAFTRFLVLQP